MSVSERLVTGPGHTHPAARVLGPADLPAALRVCAADPVAAVLAATRLEVAARAGLVAAGGQVWGWPAEGELTAICWAGANLVPVLPRSLIPDTGEQAAAIAAFGARARRTGRRSSSIVGESGHVLALWEDLERYWPPARDVRSNQPSMAIGRDPDIEPDPRVQVTRLDDLPAILPACIAMFTEEVGYSPVSGGGGLYRERVRTLIAEGRSYARFAEERPAAPAPASAPQPRSAAHAAEDPYTRPAGPLVEFKAELGAVALGVAQVQGVWVDPALRGRGLSEGGMAAVVADARRRVAPVVSLYVNGYNVKALKAYRRVGFEQVGTFATVLF